MQRLSRSQVAFNLLLVSGDFPPPPKKKKKFVHFFYSLLGVFFSSLTGNFEDAECSWAFSGWSSLRLQGLTQTPCSDGIYCFPGLQ